MITTMATWRPETDVFARSALKCRLTRPFLQLFLLCFVFFTLSAANTCEALLTCNRQTLLDIANSHTVFEFTRQEHEGAD